jgi:hypothetical protein
MGSRAVGHPRTNARGSIGQDFIVLICERVGLHWGRVDHRLEASPYSLRALRDTTRPVDVA